MQGTSSTTHATAVLIGAWVWTTAPSPRSACTARGSRRCGAAPRASRARGGPGEVERELRGRLPRSRDPPAVEVDDADVPRGELGEAAARRGDGDVVPGSGAD